MKKKYELSRRDFLKITGLVISTFTIKACTSSEASLPAIESAQKIIVPIVPEMIKVEVGNFEMGSSDGRSDEQPVHKVEITKPFCIGKYEVSFEEYDTFCDATLRYTKPKTRGEGRGEKPVIGVDWQEAVDYCNWLSDAEGLSPCYSGKGKMTKCDFSANGYRLPTEAEWEYAACGGQNSQGYIFAGSNDPDIVAWHGSNAEGAPHPAGEKKPNELGLYDMSGNSFEWCWDWYVADYYSHSPAIDPLGPELPKVDSPWDLVRVRRSGNWREDADSVRIATRSFDGPSYAGDNGFRLVRNA